VVAGQGDDPRASLYGRHRECTALDRLVEQVRAGRSSVLVVRGEAGIGKTALLDYADERASECWVLRAAGVQSEMELPFAGLHQLCAPLLGLVDRLPVPQQEALRIAFGQIEGPTPDRFLVALAVLTLVSEAATDQAVVCLVDDAQWLDHESTQVMAFVARRVLAEHVGLVFAVRGPDSCGELTGLPELLVEGIRDSAARSLLTSLIQGRLDERVQDRLIAEARGNPLALREFMREGTPADPAGGFSFLGAQPLGTRMEQGFVRRLRALSHDAQLLMLVAAAEPTGSVPLLWRAARQVGIAVDAAVEAEDSGLIEFGARVRFRHPLIRSAAYLAASDDDRQKAHQALAESTDAKVDPDRRAWHRARAARLPDESVAEELEHSANRAQQQGGMAAAAAFLERASELTPDPTKRGGRALAAAEAKLEAGAPDSALGLLANAQAGPLDQLQRARLDMLRARVALVVNRGRDAPPLLVASARRMAPLDAELARETYLAALDAGIFAGRLCGELNVLEIAEAARAAPPGSRPSRPLDLLLDGLVVRFTQGYPAGVGAVKRALEAFGQQAVSKDDLRWYGLACRSAADAWDDQTWHQLATAQIRFARETGALPGLFLGIAHRATLAVLEGDFSAASALLTEAEAIAQVTGKPRLLHISLVATAWRGEEEETVAQVDAVRADATERGEGRAIAFVDYSLAVLYNSLGRYELAVAPARRAYQFDDLAVCGSSLVELVEAAAGSGQQEVAADALSRLSERARASGSDWALGLEARSRALLSDGDAAETFYREALERLARTHIKMDAARAHLLYGEWLRRQGRHAEAREKLRAGYEWLSALGAKAFAERARRELLAAGATVRKRTVQLSKKMTAQQAQIAGMARDGYTNAEIGARLFLSPRTVESHLRNVFEKLGIGSRRELRLALPATASASWPK
jgi:DNA-binding CsgD family transcriptional regulator